jgi:hypothetical protein
MRFLEEQGVVRSHQHQLATQVRHVIWEPERHTCPGAPKLSDRSRRQLGIEVDHYLAFRGEGCPDYPALRPVVQAWQGLSGDFRDTPGQTSANSLTGCAQLGDHVTRAVQRVADIVREAVRTCRTHNTDPHAQPSLGCFP